MATGADTKERCGFTDIIRPNVICTSVNDFKNSGSNRYRKFHVRWRYTGDPSAYQYATNWVLYRLVSPRDTIIEPSDRKFYNPNNNPHWVAVGHGNGAGPGIDDDGFYNIVDIEFTDGRSLASLFNDVASGRVAVYYRVECYISKMSACSLPLFVYCDNDTLRACSTKNQVVLNRFYGDREPVWKTDSTGGHKFVRVVVDTSDTDFTTGTPTVKRRAVWATTFDGYIYCFDYWTGRYIGHYNTGAEKALLAVAFDPIHSMFLVAQPVNINTVVLCGWKLLNGGGIGQVMWTSMGSSDWPDANHFGQTIVGAACAVVDSVPIVSVIFDNQTIRKFSISYSGGSFRLNLVGNISKKAFGCIGNIAAAQPNLFGIVNAFGHEMWTNCHPPLTWAESYIKEDKGQVKYACSFKKPDGTSPTTCYSVYKDSTEGELKRYLGYDLCDDMYKGEQDKIQSCQDHISVAASVLKTAMDHPKKKYVLDYGLAYRHMEVDRSRSKHWKMYKAACIGSKGDDGSTRNEEDCKSVWTTNNQSTQRVPNPPNDESQISDNIACLFGAGAPTDSKEPNAGNKYMVRSGRGRSNFSRMVFAEKARTSYNKWAAEGFPKKSSNKTDFDDYKKLANAQFNRVMSEVNRLHQWVEETYGYKTGLGSFTILQDIGMVFGFDASTGGGNVSRVTNGQSEESEYTYRSDIRGPLGDTEKPPTDTTKTTFGTAKWKETNAAARLDRAATKFHAFTKPMVSTERRGWIGTAIYYDDCKQNSILEGELRTIDRLISDGVFTYGATSKSDLYVRKPYAGHTDQGVVYTRPPQGSFPTPSQFGIGVSLPAAGFLRPQAGSVYTIYQADAVEKRVHKLPRTLGSDNEHLAATTAAGVQNLEIETDGVHPHHVICDDANTVWVVSNNRVDRFYPDTLEALTYGKVRLIKNYANYESASANTGYSDCFVGKHGGNLYCTEFYLLMNGGSRKTVGKMEAKNALDSVSQGTPLTNTRVFDLDANHFKSYGDGNGNYYHYSVANKTDAFGYANTALYSNNNEYNEDNLGIAPIRARGSVPVEDICHPSLTFGLPSCHLKIVKATESDKTLSCDSEIFGSNPFSNTLIKPGNANGSVPSTDANYDNDNYHLTAHGYDDLQVWHRLWVEGLEGWIVKSAVFYATGNASGPQGLSKTVSSNGSGNIERGFVFTNGSNAQVAGGSNTWETVAGGFAIHSNGVRVQTVATMYPEYLWTEPNVRGKYNTQSGKYENTTIGAATQPNYGQRKRVYAKVFLSGAIDIYDIYSTSSSNALSITSNYNDILVYERWPYPDYCGDGITDYKTVTESFWGPCEDEDQTRDE